MGLKDIIDAVGLLTKNPRVGATVLLTGATMACSSGDNNTTDTDNGGNPVEMTYKVTIQGEQGYPANLTATEAGEEVFSGRLDSINNYAETVTWQGLSSKSVADNVLDRYRIDFDDPTILDVTGSNLSAGKTVSVDAVLDDNKLANFLIEPKYNGIGIDDIQVRLVNLTTPGEDYERIIPDKTNVPVADFGNIPISVNPTQFRVEFKSQEEDPLYPSTFSDEPIKDPLYNVENSPIITINQGDAKVITLDVGDFEKIYANIEARNSQNGSPENGKRSEGANIEVWRTNTDRDLLELLYTGTTDEFGEVNTELPQNEYVLIRSRVNNGFLVTWDYIITPSGDLRQSEARPTLRVTEVPKFNYVTRDERGGEVKTHPATAHQFNFYIPRVWATEGLIEPMLVRLPDPVSDEQATTIEQLGRNLDDLASIAGRSLEIVDYGEKLDPSSSIYQNYNPYTYNTFPGEIVYVVDELGGGETNLLTKGVDEGGINESNVGITNNTQVWKLDGIGPGTFHELLMALGYKPASASEMGRPTNLAQLNPPGTDLTGYDPIYGDREYLRAMAHIARLTFYVDQEVDPDSTGIISPSENKFNYKPPFKFDE